MKINKFNIFIYFTILFVHLSAVSDDDESEYSSENLSDEQEISSDFDKEEDYNDNKYKKRKEKNYTKIKSDQINEYQEKLFGEKKYNKREFAIDREASKEIIKYYLINNVKFKEEAENFRTADSHQKLDITETFLHGLCVLYLYGNVSLEELARYFKMMHPGLKRKMHENKIHLFYGYKRILHKRNENYRNKIEQIKSTIDSKNEEICGGKWELNLVILYHLTDGTYFYHNILNLAKDVKNSISVKNKSYLQAIYENGNFHFLRDINDDNNILPINTFMIKFINKFNAILYDFERELIWSFHYNRQIYVFNKEASAEIICNLLFFRALLEFLKSIMLEYEQLVDVQNEDKKVVNDLIELFDEGIKSPEELFNLKLNKHFYNETKKMIKQKISKFIEDYINGQLHLFINTNSDNNNSEDGN